MATGKPQVKDRKTTDIIGVLLIAFSLVLFIASIYMAYNGKISAGLLAATIGGVSLITGADMLKTGKTI
ncbi:MAG: hypothetical protein F7C36_04210 [Desulfurococcales archaeon]|nr:hypothetical protein [Desulfurococcales archaeon]